MGDEEETPINPATGDVYEGERNAEGKRHGSGVAKYANGDVFKGEYAEGKRHGKGVYYFGGEDAPKATYDGMYADNLKSGPGTMTYPDGTKVRCPLLRRRGTWEQERESSSACACPPAAHRRGRLCPSVVACCMQNAGCRAAAT